MPDVLGDSFGVTRPLVVPSPAGLAGGDAGWSQPSTGSVSCSAVLPTVPAVSTPEESLVFQAADGNQFAAGHPGVYIQNDMAFSSMIHACWSMSALRNWHGY